MIEAETTVPKVHKQAKQYSHGHATRNGWTQEFRAWRGMRMRCYLPSAKGYHNYGGRGIKVCERWSEFANFLADMGLKPSPKHSLDRKDTNGNYEPGNCRWATKLEQDNNRRTNVHFTHNGETLTMAQWARKLCINIGTLEKRLKNWPIDKALGTPVENQVRLIEHNGKSQRLSEWSRETGLSAQAIAYRLKSGWDVHRALTTPSGK